MKTKFMFISCTLALIMTVAAWAETPVSPQSKATEGLKGTEVDQFMSTTDWSSVTFDKLFTYAGFEQKTAGSQQEVNLGAAFKAGPVYIGSWYKGEFGKVDTRNHKDATTQLMQSSALPGTIDNTIITRHANIDKSHNAVHNVAVLVGFSNMGLRLGYARAGVNSSGTYFNGSAQSDTKTTQSKSDAVVSGTTYDPKGYINNANRTAAVDFGMNLSIGSLSLSPKAGLAVDIKQKSAYGSQTVSTENKILETYRIDKTIQGFNRTATNLKVTLGADLGLNDALNSAFSFGYDFDADIYGKKKHTAADGSKKELANIYTITTDAHSVVENGTGRTVTDSFDAITWKKTSINNTLTAGYTMRKDFTDRLSLFAGVEAPIGFNFDKDERTLIYKKTTKYTFKAASDKVNNRTEIVEKTAPTTTTNRTIVTLDPAFKAALTYAAIPNRVFISFGTEVKPFGSGKCTFTTAKTTVNRFTQTTDTTTTYENDSSRNTYKSETTPVAGTESITHTVNYGKVAVAVNLGMRWNIVDAVSFDLAYNKSALETIKWTEFGNLKLACTIKF